MSASTRAGCLTDGVDQHPHCVLLLDEIEKAHPDLFNVLLQVMDHGKLTDHNGKQVDFRNVILIMTTNAGASEMAKSAFGFTRTKREGDDHEAINRMFTPEFRNRLDATITFAHLSQEIIAKVVEKFVLQLEAQLGDRNVTIELSEEAARWLIANGYDELMGARPMARVIQEHIKKPLADEVLFGHLKGGGHVRVVVTKDEDGRDKLGFEFLDGPVTPKPEKLPAVRPKAKRRSSPRPEGQAQFGAEGAPDQGLTLSVFKTARFGRSAGSIAPGLRIFASSVSYLPSVNAVAARIPATTIVSVIYAVHWCFFGERSEKTFWKRCCIALRARVCRFGADMPAKAPFLSASAFVRLDRILFAGLHRSRRANYRAVRLRSALASHARYLLYGLRIHGRATAGYYWHSRRTPSSA